MKSQLVSDDPNARMHIVVLESGEEAFAALMERLGLKPRLAFAPLRAALTGRRISPPLFESIELLGRESTLARIAAARAATVA